MRAVKQLPNYLYYTIKREEAQRLSLIHIWFQQGMDGGGLRAQSLPGIGVSQSGDGAHGPGPGPVHPPEAGAGVDPQLIRLFLPDLLSGGTIPAGEEVLHLQFPAGDFQIGQPVSCLLYTSSLHKNTSYI